MIKVIGLTKKFIDSDGKEFTVLDNLNFQVNSNEFISIVGPVGCGKSTLLHIIAGLEKPTSGHVLIDNKIVKSPSPLVGIIFQNSLLFPWKTVKENLTVCIKSKKGKHACKNEIVEKYLEEFNLSEFANLYPKQLSGGMKQKVSFARVLISNPKILLMDEPFSSLDVQMRALCQLELMKVFEQSKKTILFVTHDIEEAIFLSDKIIVLSSCPTKILEIIKVNFPRPRKENLKSKKSFQELRKEIWEMIKKEIFKIYLNEINKISSRS